MRLLELLRAQSTLKQALIVGGLGTATYVAYQRYAGGRQNDKEDEDMQKRLALMPDTKKKKVAVNAEFFRRLRLLLRIVLPNMRCKEFFILCLHTMFLVSRTLVSIYVAELDGSIVKSIVDRKLKLFVFLMMKWVMIAVPATYINSMIMYLESKLSIAFRTRLVKHVYEMYMKDETYYRVGNLDSRLSNPDQCLTEDVSVFCTDLAHLYSHLSKPCLDVVLMTIKLIYLSKNRGAGQGHVGQPLFLAAGVVLSTGYILKLATPPFGKLIAEQARRYGELRAAHSRVITHAEEIAFYGGHVVERNVLQSSYDDLIKHINYIYRKKIWYTMLEQFLMRYIWGACGLTMIAIPAFYRYNLSIADSISNDKSPVALPVDTKLDNVSTRTQDFVTSRGLLISAADAIERMMSSWKEVTELAGRTARIYEMIDIFEQMKRGEYVKIQTNSGGATIEEIKEGEEESKEGEKDKNGVLISPKSGKRKKAKMRQKSVGNANDHVVQVDANTSVNTYGGGVVYDNSPYIELKGVPVVTPNGDMLLDPPYLNFTIHPGMHLLITGPNGCGKSSLFRMLGGLWPVRGGTLRKPGKGSLFYIPQRPYLTRGTFREQFLYPDSEADFRAKGLTDADLHAIIDIVALGGVIEREGGLDAENDWRDVLSGGEKQRVGMARVFYHKPCYAILDECTSAVSIDVEAQMYQGIIDAGITLLTVTHRPSLWKFHTHLLQFDGTGLYTFSELNATVRLSYQEEKNKLESQLAAHPVMTERLKELCGLLGENSIHIDSSKAHSSTTASEGASP